MELENKTILLISPQKWSDFMVSKHHYARELALKGNLVYFLNPFQKKRMDIQIRCHSSILSLKFVDYGFYIPDQLRFHIRWLFNILMRRKVKSIIKVIDKPIDIVWCFEPNLFSDLDWFNAKLKIFHPVDFLTQRYQLLLGRTADLILSVADNILDFFKENSPPRYFINHGLSQQFESIPLHNYIQNSHLKFAYIGSLYIPGLDRVNMRKIILKHPKITFDFYGRFEGNPNASAVIMDFIDFLKYQVNVNLMGIKNPKELSLKLTNYDGFLLFYKPDIDFNSASNSHKILEYLSTGRLIISSLVKAYENNTDIIIMSKKDNNEDYVELFDYSIANIQSLNDIKLMKKRRDLSLNNTYQKQIEKIESLITALK